MESRPRISIIAAIGKNRELGKDGTLVWRIPEDLKRVKALTMGHPIIMGRATYESIGRPLPGRTNIVVTSRQMCIDGVLIYDSIEKAIAAASAIDNEEVFIFGGAQIYSAAIAHADRLYLTLIDATDPDADVFFPEYSEFTRVVTQEKKEGHDDLPSYSYLTLERE